MTRLFILLLTLIAASANAQSLKERITPNDPSKYRQLSAVHAGAGQMGFTQLIGRNQVSTNFLYLHSGVIEPKSGIGHHFHHNIEEMYVILNGEAEFTINGRTSKIKAPAIVPCKMGDSHAIYNPSGEKLQWLNFAVSLNGPGDNFDLADTRVGATLDKVPTFVSDRLEKEKLTVRRPAQFGGNRTTMSRRVFGPEIFSTDWNHVDHIVIPADSAIKSRKLEGVEEIYYVIKGNGTIGVNGEKAAIKASDALFGGIGEDVSFTNGGKEDLEILVIGVAASKQKQLAIGKPLTKPKAMALQMDFIVDKANAEAFEKMYYSIYVPAMTVQKGYLSSKLLRRYSENMSKEIEAEATEFNYQIQISFDTEDNRRKWVASDQHQIAWPAATSLAKEFKWRGYDVMGDDDQQR
jgi:mannose-6-phosphate isomerase-like protein (cupin superfamily)/heme-degrading monooxygenase HmoA